jgi:hypothetical protein
MTCERSSLVVGVLSLASLGFILNYHMQGTQEDPIAACDAWRDSIEKTNHLFEELEFKQWNPLHEMAKKNRECNYEAPSKELSSISKVETQLSKKKISEINTQERKMELAKLRYTIHWQCKKPPSPNCSKPHPCHKR